MCIQSALIGILLSASSGAQYVGPELPEEVDVFEEAIASWVRDVSFCCNYRIRRGYARSVEEAEQGRFDEGRTESSSMVYSGGGRMCKDGTRVRYSLRYDGGWIDATPPAGMEGTGNYNTNTSFDEMTDDVIEVRYEPKERNYGDAIKFRDRTLSDDAHTAAPGPMASIFPTPLAPLTGYGRPFIKMLPFKALGDRGVPADVKVKLHEVDSETLQVTAIYRRSPLWEYERQVTFWIKPSPPVIKRIDTRLDHNDERDGLRHSANHAILSDFVKCPGGMVARRVVNFDENPGGAVLLSIWESNDLGTRDCTAEDFTIKVEPTTKFSGLSRIVSFSHRYHVALDELTLSDIGHKVFRGREVFPPAESVQPVAPSASGTSSEQWILAVGFVTAVVLIVSYSVWQRRATGP